MPQRRRGRRKKGLKGIGGKGRNEEECLESSEFYKLRPE
jgi:hypothetical protein